MAASSGPARGPEATDQWIVHLWSSNQEFQGWNATYDSHTCQYVLYHHSARKSGTLRIMSESPAERLRWARRQAGFTSAAAFARVVDVPEVTYRAHEKGVRAVGGRGLSEHAARLYAEPLGVTWAWLLTGVGDPKGAGNGSHNYASRTTTAKTGRATPDATAGTLPGSLEVPATGGMTRDVPVHGVAVGGEAGCFEFNGDVVDYVLRPPGVERARDVFAMYVLGDSMVPRFEEGDLVFVHPGRPPVNGCDVLVELHGEEGDPGPCFIKRLVRRTPTKVVLQQFNPPRSDIEIGMNRLRVLYRILTAGELLGV